MILSDGTGSLWRRIPRLSFALLLCLAVSPAVCGTIYSWDNGTRFSSLSGAGYSLANPFTIVAGPDVSVKTIMLYTGDSSLGYSLNVYASIYLWGTDSGKPGEVLGHLQNQTVLQGGGGDDGTGWTSFDLSAFTFTDPARFSGTLAGGQTIWAGTVAEAPPGEYNATGWLDDAAVGHRYVRMGGDWTQSLFGHFDGEFMLRMETEPALTGVPEPNSLLLMAMSLGLIVALRRMHLGRRRPTA